MRKKNKKFAIAGVFLLILILGILSFGPLQQQAFTEDGKPIKYATPVTDSIVCGVIDFATISTTIPTNGVSLKKSTMGFNAYQVENIKVSITQSVWNSYLKNFLGGGVRVVYSTCGYEGAQPCLEDTKKLLFPGTYTSSNMANFPSSIDLRTTSLNVKIQTKNTIVSKWKNADSNAKIQYSADKYGLISDTEAGGIDTKFCTTSCNLNCLDVGIKKNLISAPNDEIKPNQAVNYLFKWDELDVDLNNELGGTTYIESKKEFCFGGEIYSAGEMTTNEATYVFPETKIGNEDCCPGATISTRFTDKICQDDYTWKTIIGDDVIVCASDFSCPGQGDDVCRNKKLNSWGCDGFDSEIGKYCTEAVEVDVACCDNSDCEVNEVCDNTYVCKGGTNVTLAPQNECVFDSDCGRQQECIEGDCIDKDKVVVVDNIFGGDILSLKEECEYRAEQQPLLGWTFKETTTIKEPSTITKIVTLGFAKTRTETTGICKASFVIWYFLVGLFILGMTTLIIIKKGKKGIKKRKFKK